MLHHGRLALLLLPFLSLSLAEAAAQIKTGNIHVHVTYLDDRAPTAQLKVALTAVATRSPKPIPTIMATRSFSVWTSAIIRYPLAARAFSPQ